MSTQNGSYFIWADLFRGKQTKQANPLVEALRGNLLFATLDEKELRYLSTMVYSRVYETGEPVFQQNERGFGLYIIEQGTIAIKSQGPGGEVLITTLGKGNFFGELALIEENSLRTASAIPQERSTVIGFFKPDLMEILERKPNLGVKILLQLATVLGKRLLETTERVVSAGPTT